MAYFYAYILFYSAYIFCAKLYVKTNFL